jgi:eukaryotic-like serine/threonine-protein kinase
MVETPIEELRFVLPRDVVLVPVRDLTTAVRRQIECSDTDYAVSRPRMRRPTKIVDAGSADLLQEFRAPCRLVEAVVRHCGVRGLDPYVTLEQAFEVLQAFVSGALLVEASDPAAQEVEASFVAGMCLGDFEVTRLVQALDDSELYEAIGMGGQRVALKVLRPTAPAAAVEMLRREAAVLGALDGPWAPRLVSAQEAQGRHFLAIEWISGVNVASAAARLRSGEPRLLHALCGRLLDAFAEIHRRGILHGDVHPGNILVRPDGSVCVLDFGRSRFRETHHPFASAPRAGIGYYYEPELASALVRGQPPPEVSEAGEQFALAALVYFALTGGHYQDFSLEHDKLIRSVAAPRPLPFARRGARAAPALEAVLKRALRQDPSQRHASVEELAAAFRRAIPRRSAVRSRGGQAEALIGDVDFRSPLFRQGMQGQPNASVAAGAGGIALFLQRAAMVREDPHLLALADSWAERIDTAGARSFADGTSTASTYHGSAGIFFVRALIGEARSDRNARASAVRDFLEAVGAGDVLPALAGAVTAAALLGDPELRGWIAAQARRQFLTADRGRPGVAHGRPGEVYALLKASQALGVAPGPDVLCELQRLSEQSPATAPGWCRGRAGMVYLWKLAHEVLGDERFLALGDRDALAAFQHPDGDPTLCSGLAGRSLALLHWYQQTGEPVWLRRARETARRAVRAAPLLEGRPGLLRGRAGIALLEVELQAPEDARMPLFS